MKVLIFLVLMTLSSCNKTAPVLVDKPMEAGYVPIVGTNPSPSPTP